MKCGLNRNLIQGYFGGITILSHFHWVFHWESDDSTDNW